jgi:calcium-dependent protein kinase
MGTCTSNNNKHISSSSKSLATVKKPVQEQKIEEQGDGQKFKRREGRGSTANGTTVSNRSSAVTNFTRKASRTRSLVEAAKSGSRASEKELEFVVNSHNIIDQNTGLPMDDYKLVKKLGDGSFGSVYLVNHRLNKMERAMKKIRKTQGYNKQDEEEVFNEINILKTLDHFNIVKIFEFYNTREAYYIITEFCEEGELYEKIKNKFTEEHAAFIFYQVFSGINYLHRNNIIHRDLKLENILIDSIDENGFYHIKIIDFGTAKFQQKNKSERAVIGSSYYMAPEVLKKSYNEKCDTWSCGVILYMLLFGVPPFDAKTDEEILERIKKGKYDNNSERWNRASPEARDLIEKLLEMDVSKRFSAREALLHPFFKVNKTFELMNMIEPERCLQLIESIHNYKFETKLQQMVLAFIVHNIKENDEMRDAQKLFRIFDQNLEGRIGKKELLIGLSQFAPEGHDLVDKIDDIFLSLDGDNNGYIECGEFIRACIDKKFLLKDEILRFAFNYFDKDASGKISFEELKTTFKLKNDISTLKVLENMLNDIDVNGDGQIDFQEFKQMMKSMV